MNFCRVCRRIARTFAFDAATKDPEFLAEAKSLNLDVNPVGATKIDALLKAIYIYASPPEIAKLASSSCAIHLKKGCGANRRNGKALQQAITEASTTPARCAHADLAIEGAGLARSFRPAAARSPKSDHIRLRLGGVARAK